jgi:hypothetical protein
MIYNTRERVISQDQNRAERFAAADRAESYRLLMNNRNAVFTGGGGVVEFGSYVDTVLQNTAAVGTPLRGDVIDGLVVLPQAGSLNLLVSPGVVGLDDPDGETGSSDPNPANPDDSRYKIVDDPGVTNLGTLVMSAGSGGQTRIDVIEVQRNSTVLETDNRDIFNPSTGLFSPIAVTKVIQGELTYRVREGTPGAGLPANVQGWLPLCVASVPSAAASVDDMTFWDVRPLVKDRIAAGTDLQSILQPIDPGSYLNSNDFTDTTKTLLTGVVNSRAAMYLAGGAIGIDLQDPVNQAAGASFTAGDPWYLWAIFPGNLPRWVRYVDSPTVPRIPNAGRGILAVYQFGAATDLGFGTVPPPTATGITGSQTAVLLAAGICADLGAGPVPVGITLSAGETVPSDGAFMQGPAPTAVGSADQYALVAGTNFPKMAKAVKVALASRISGTVAVGFTYTNEIAVYADAGFTQLIGRYIGSSNFSAFDPATGFRTVLFEAWIPRVILGSSNGYANDNLYFIVEWLPIPFTGSATRDLPNLLVTGWKL